MSDKEKLLAKIEQLSDYDASVLLMQLERWRPMPILVYADGETGSRRKVSWTSEKLGLVYPNLVRQMAHKGYNLPDLQTAMGEKTWQDAAQRLENPELDVLTGYKIVRKLFPEMGMNIFDSRRF